MNRSLMRAILLITVLLSACASAQSRRDDYIAAHPGLNPEITEALREGKISKGMTEDDVRAAWGDPERETVTVAEGGTSKIWAYDTPIGKQFTQGTVLLTFRNGKLVKLVN